MLRRYQLRSLVLLNFNVIHMSSNWFFRKAQEKFQVESRLCKTTGCSYVTLLATYLPKKTIFKASNKNTRKRSLLISKITLKTSERPHLTTGYWPEVMVQNHVWTVFPRIYTNLQSKVCFRFCCSTARSFNNSKPIHVILWEIITEIFYSWKFKMLTFFHFWKNSPKNGHIFQLFTLNSKGRHFSITKLDILIFCNILHLEIDFWNLNWERIVSS